MTVVKDRKIRNALRTNQTAGFVTASPWEKINIDYFMVSARVRYLRDVTKTGNGEWGMGNGEWGMGNGEWGMGNGKWEIENGKWEIDFFHINFL